MGTPREESPSSPRSPVKQEKLESTKTTKEEKKGDAETSFVQGEARFTPERNMRNRVSKKGRVAGSDQSGDSKVEGRASDLSVPFSVKEIKKRKERTS